MLSSLNRFKYFLLLLLCSLRPARRARAGLDQNRYRPGLEKPRVAVADFAPRADQAKNHSALFTQVVRDDLQFSGILELVSPSFYPPQAPSQPSELRNLTWTDPPANANMVAFGNLTESTPEVAIQAWFFDVRNPAAQPLIAKVYRGAPTDAQVRSFAHQFADEIINKLSGGLPGIAGTQIAFVSSRTGTKEIWVMDYDGANQHPITSLRSICAHAPLVSRCFAHRLHLLQAHDSRHQRADLHAFLDTGKLVSFPAVQGHQQLSVLVARRLANNFFFLHGRKSRTLRCRLKRRPPQASYQFEWRQHFRHLES